MRQTVRQVKEMQEQKEWEDRLEVKECIYIYPYDCPFFLCDHIDNRQGVRCNDCCEESCPLWDGKRWKKEKGNKFKGLKVNITTGDE